jgi:hypothetical protein
MDFLLDIIMSEDTECKIGFSLVITGDENLTVESTLNYLKKYRIASLSYSSRYYRNYSGIALKSIMPRISIAVTDNYKKDILLKIERLSEVDIIYPQHIIDGYNHMLSIVEDYVQLSIEEFTEDTFRYLEYKG